MRPLTIALTPLILFASHPALAQTSQAACAALRTLHLASSTIDSTEYLSAGPSPPTRGSFAPAPIAMASRPGSSQRP